jgi:hypothetical protein
MSIFLQQSHRYAEALNRFDPLEREPLLRILDPIGSGPSKRPAGCPIPLLGPATFVLLVCLPVVVFASIPHPTFGGRLLGPNGLLRDVGFGFELMFVCAMLVLLLVGRRVLGDLMNELIMGGIASTRTWADFKPAATARSRMLRFLERLSRPGARATAVWLLAILAFNLYAYLVFIGDGRIHWTSSANEPGSLFSHFQVGGRQPNLAGLWSFLVLSPLLGYLVVLAARLFVCFACVCQALADDPDLHVIPTHPDRTGGLLAVGQVSFFFAIFTFAVGVMLMGMTLSELLIMETSHIAFSDNLRTILGLWGFYLVAGTLLFFTPAMPLRNRMADAKRTYLHEAHVVYAAGALRHRESLRKVDRVPETFQELRSHGELITTAEQMAVWPFDRDTFLRFGTVLFGPIAPLLFDQAPRIVAWLKAYLLQTPR